VNGGQRIQFHGLRDFFKAWRIAMLIQEGDQKIEHFFLPFGQSHGCLAIRISPQTICVTILGEVKAKVNCGIFHYGIQIEL
jgi:hypothetical protein